MLWWCVAGARVVIPYACRAFVDIRIVTSIVVGAPSWPFMVANGEEKLRTNLVVFWFISRRWCQIDIVLSIGARERAE